MSIPLKLGTATKRVNSTAVPDSTLWTNYDVFLKQDTSLERPRSEEHTSELQSRI